MRRPVFFSALALATLSGCLWFLAVTPFDASYLAWFAAVPMFMAIEQPGTFRRALLLGWWAGVVETAGGFYWLVDLMQRFAEFPWIAAALVTFVFCAARALIFLLFTAVVCGVRRRWRVPMTLLAPVAMVAGEFVVPQIFPCGQWISQAWQPRVIQITELTGPLGVTALLMLVNGAWYDVWVAVRGRRAGGSGAALRPALLAAAAAAALFAAALVFGTVRMRQIDAAIARAPRLAVGLVQPNFAYSASGEMGRDELLHQLAELQGQSQRLAKSGAELLVWSEGSFPVAVPRDFAADFPEDSRARIRRNFEQPTIIGADMVDEANDRNYNSAVLLDRNGNVAGYYDKVRLLAFGEYIPGVEAFPWLRKILPDGAGQFTPGKGPAILPLQTQGGRVWRLGPVICYEDILQDFLLDVGKLHPDLLVNLTSDSWFGANTEPWEHLALSVFASIELRVSMVRAVNSGISALIDANGRVVAKTYANDPYRAPRGADSLQVSVPMMSGGHTFYVAAGNWFAWICLAASVAFCVALMVATRRARPRAA